MYPNKNDVNDEMSFEELRAQSRGWLGRDWAFESKQKISQQYQTDQGPQETPSVVRNSVESSQTLQDSQSTQATQPAPEIQSSPSVALDNTISVDINREGRNGKPRKTRMKEVKGETQTSTQISKVRRIKLISCSQN